MCARHGVVRRPAPGSRGRHWPAYTGGAPGAEWPDPEVRRPSQTGGGFLVSRVYRLDAVVAHRARVFGPGDRSRTRGRTAPALREAHRIGGSVAARAGAPAL